MESIKNHISEYRYLVLFVVPAFFLISYLFNVVYFSCFDISISKVPLTTQDYILSINILGIVLLYGISCHALGQFLGHICGKKIITNNIEHQSGTNNTLMTVNKSLHIFTKILLIFSVAALIIFFVTLYIHGMIAALFSILTIPIMYIYFKFFIHYDGPSVIIIVVLPLCLIMTLSTAVKNARDDYSKTAIEITTGGNKYFIMRNFENGYWVKSPDTGEILFITKNNDILNFGIPKNATDYLKSNSDQQPDKKLDIVPQSDAPPSPLHPEEQQSQG